MQKYVDDGQVKLLGLLRLHYTLNNTTDMNKPSLWMPYLRVLVLVGLRDPPTRLRSENRRLTGGKRSGNPGSWNCWSVRFNAASWNAIS